MSLQKRELFEVWCHEKDVKTKNIAVLNYVVRKLNIEDLDESKYTENMKKVVKNFTSKINEKWHNCNRTLKGFNARYHQWLDEEIDIPGQCGVTLIPANSVGRPRKPFSEVGAQSKRQKVASLLDDYSTEELSFAVSTNLRKSGQRDAAKIIQCVSNHSLNATRIKKLVNSSPTSPIKYTPEEALALYVDGRYTKNSYILMQSGAKLRNADIYPSYNLLKKAKNCCYPDENNITISEIHAEVKLQALVDHTATRLVHLQQEVMEQCLTEIQHGVTLIHKWGCDGSSGHSNYKQKFTEENGTSLNDSSLFAVCIVPLQLQTSSNNNILWNNPRPSSTRYCRPIKLIFEKETNEVSKREIGYIENQIKKIVPTKINISNKTILVNHCFKLTMIDGKVFSVITQSSNQTCGICGATPKNMNNLEDIYKRTPNKEYLKFGVSSLHAWIRSLEALLHISYRIPIQKWQVKDKTDKQIVQHRKEEVRSRLRSEMGLLIDIPKPGFGTTNDGNTARRFFLQSHLVSPITGLNAELVQNFSVILRTMSSGYAINVEAFKEYTKKTAEKYVECYSWYYMPSSIHKILIHGADIIKEAILPIGVFSEEALESRNKDFKKYREFNTRKSSREKTMRDLLNCLLVSSDPIISSLSKSSSFSKSNHNLSLDSRVIALLSDPAIPSSLGDDSTSNIDSVDSEDSDE